MSKLYVIATPIGNLSDISPRVIAAISECDIIAAEDTRVTMKLLSHIDVKKPLISCHRHNEDARSEQIIERMLNEDITVGLTCDAGTPAVSDPGYMLVSAAWEAGIAVVPISGPSAVVTAISISGFDSRDFGFFGFLPREKKALREKLSAIAQTGLALAVMYESPHRITELVEVINAEWQNPDICVCCDLTKKYELILRGKAYEVLAKLKENPNTEKGEYCVVAKPPVAARIDASSKKTAEEFTLPLILNGMDIDTAITEAQNNGYSRNELYKLKIKIKNRFDM